MLEGVLFLDTPFDFFDCPVGKIDRTRILQASAEGQLKDSEGESETLPTVQPTPTSTPVLAAGDRIIAEKSVLSDLEMRLVIAQEARRRTRTRTSPGVTSRS